MVARLNKFGHRKNMKEFLLIWLTISGLIIVHQLNQIIELIQ